MLSREQLIEKIKNTILGNNSGGLTEEEINQQIFVACFVKALVQLKYIQAQITFSQDQKLEELKSFLSRHQAIARKIHKRFLEDEDDEIMAQAKALAEQQNLKPILLEVIEVISREYLADEQSNKRSNPNLH